MKKILLFSLLLFSTSVFSQDFILRIDTEVDSQFKYPQGYQPTSCLELMNDGVVNAQTGINKLFTSDGQTSYIAYCDMDTEGGGWTLAGIMADDDNNFWYFNNINQTYRTNTAYGTISNLKNDYIGEAWFTIESTDLMLQDSENTKGVYYSNILSNTTLSHYFTNATWDNHVANDLVITRAPTSYYGNWWGESGCSLLHMRFGFFRQPCYSNDCARDYSFGFAFATRHNNNYCWEDAAGSLTRRMSDGAGVNQEFWHPINKFYLNNFGGDAKLIFVR